MPTGQAWAVEAMPKSVAIKERTGRDETHLWVRQENDLVVRAIRWVHKSSQTWQADLFTPRPMEESP